MILAGTAATGIRLDNRKFKQRRTLQKTNFSDKNFERILGLKICIEEAQILKSQDFYKDSTSLDLK